MAALAILLHKEKQNRYSHQDLIRDLHLTYFTPGLTESQVSSQPILPFRESFLSLIAFEIPAMNTFTIQSVHGLTHTFVVNPNGTVKTAQSGDTQREKAPDSERQKRDDSADRN